MATITAVRFSLYNIFLSLPPLLGNLRRGLIQRESAHNQRPADAGLFFITERQCHELAIYLKAGPRILPARSALEVARG